MPKKWEINKNSVSLVLQLNVLIFQLNIWDACHIVEYPDIDPEYLFFSVYRRYVILLGHDLEDNFKMQLERFKFFDLKNIFRLPSFWYWRT